MRSVVCVSAHLAAVFPPVGQLPLVPLAVQEASVEVGQSRGRQQHQQGGGSAQHSETCSSFNGTAGCSPTDMENRAAGAVSQHIQKGFFLLFVQNQGLPAVCLSLRPPLVQPHQDSCCTFKHEVTKEHLKIHVVLQNSAGPESLGDVSDGLQIKNIKNL